MRVRGTLEYLGTRWSGFQLQPDQPTIQGALERALGIALGSPVRVSSAGRTDAGVHASGQVIAFEVPEETDLRKLVGSINALAGRGIAVVDLVPAHPGFDPRRHALSRTYEYVIVNERPASPFLVDRSWNVRAPLDLALLRLLASMLVGERDFSAFRAADCESLSTWRNVLASDWRREGHVLTYRVTANAFLKQMVRTMVGSMVDVALGRLSRDAFAALLEGGTRTKAGRTAPAQGLTLVHVEYPPGG